MKDEDIGAFTAWLFSAHGYDYRGYAQKALERRLGDRMRTEGCDDLRALRAHAEVDPNVITRIVDDLSIAVTTMFRDPEFFAAMKAHVVPVLRTYPFFRIWHAGCATGEEVYSLAIILDEAGLLQRARIYATDVNEAALATARQRLLPLEKMREYTRHYLRAGGERSFSDYYSARFDNALLSEHLAERIVFATHNLATDGVFCECNVIICRNVLIYFAAQMQERVLALFDESLCDLGFLALGKKENLRFTEMAARYLPLVEQERIYRKAADAAPVKVIR